MKRATTSSKAASNSLIDSAVETTDGELLEDPSSLRETEYEGEFGLRLCLADGVGVSIPELVLSLPPATVTLRLRFR